MSKETGALAAIQRQVMWNRLIAVVEEQAQTMIRTAFSTTVREAGDLSAGIFDLQGRMLAQAVTGTPGHVNSMMESVGHFLAKFPADTMRPGDHYITNDPWLGTGHLHDLTVVTPAFRGGAIVGLFANTAHVIDVGGLGMGPDGRSVFEEGLYIPIVKCFDRGVANGTFFDILRMGSRLPVELEGDVYSLCACNDAGARRLVEMMDEFDMASLDALAGFIFDASARATLAEIAKLAPGTYRAEISGDGYDEPITLHAAMTIGAETIDVDFAGTSGLSRRGINVPAAYCRAYSCFGIKVVVAPDIPNNWASLAPFRMHIPEGCILNAPRPFPVSVRHVTGQLLPDLMMGCLHQVVPGRVVAEGASCLWNPPLRGGASVSGQGRGNRPVLPDFEVITFNSGGTGARPDRDGLDGIAFPSGVRTMPVEATENVAPVIFWRKELRPDSGGAGRARGGLGQIMEIGTKGEREFAVNAIFDRVANPPKGRDGGGPGAAGVVRLVSGPKLRTKGFQIVPDGERLLLLLPGGGGFGDPATRDPARVAGDVRDGMVTVEEAAALYRVAVSAGGVVDAAATARLRSGGDAPAPPAFAIRRLLAADVEAYRAIRLAGLLTDPAAFGSTHASESGRPLTHHAQRLADSTVLGAFAGERLVGIVGLKGEDGPKDAHKGFVWGFYVAPEARGRGVGGALVAALLEAARGLVEQLTLTVVADNRSAVALYERAGFVAYGREPRAHKTASGYADELLMARIV